MPLSLVSTPIGNLGDMTLRAIHTLQEVDLIACEDTRVTLKLLSHLSIRKPLLAYHDHNAQAIRPRLLKKLQEGQHIALVSDAGTPLISDPGYKLVKACYEFSIQVTCLPGASSVLPALLLSGFAPYPFVFCGFAADLEPWKKVQATLLFFEAPTRFVKTLHKMKEALPGRPVAIARELTKFYEECKRGSYEEIIKHYEEYPPKGEIVIVLGPYEQRIDTTYLSFLLKNEEGLKKTELTKRIMKETGLNREEAYKAVVGAVGFEPTTR